MTADLHNHSYYSDGSLAPAQVAALAKAKGLDVVALSDHDTVAGVPEMLDACRKLHIACVPAVEISSYDADGDVHILGLNIDITDSRFLRLLGEMKAARTARMREMLALLAKHGMPLPFDRAAAFARGTMARGHIAQALVAAGYEKSIADCFQKWLHADCPCYVANHQITPTETIDAIHAAGGLAVLAHPVRMRKSDETHAAFVSALTAAGLDGIEADYRDSTPERIAFFRNLAMENGLFVTPGSDFHDPDRSTMRAWPLDPAAAKALLLLEKK